MVGVVKHLQASHSLPGDVLNQEHIFQPICQMLLAIHTAAFCLPPTDRVLRATSLLQQAAEELSEVVLHPVLAAMLTDTLAVWTPAKADTMSKVRQVYAHACFTTPALVQFTIDADSTAQASK